MDTDKIKLILPGDEKAEASAGSNNILMFVPENEHWTSVYYDVSTGCTTIKPEQNDEAAQEKLVAYIRYITGSQTEKEPEVDPELAKLMSVSDMAFVSFMTFLLMFLGSKKISYQRPTRIL